MLEYLDKKHNTQYDEIISIWEQILLMGISVHLIIH